MRGRLKMGGGRVERVAVGLMVVVMVVLLLLSDGRDERRRY